MHKVKMIGLAAVAAMALTASVGAASAAASMDVGISDDGTTAQFWSAVYPASLSGTQYTAGGNPNNTFTLKGMTTRCNSVQFSSVSNLTQKSTYIPLNAQYSNCVTNNTLTSDINMNSCHYVFHTAGKPTPPFYNGQVNVVCDLSGDSIDIHVYDSNGVAQCTQHIPQQYDVGSPQFETIPLGYGFSHQTIGVDLNTQGLTYTDDNIVCGGKGTFTNGSYVGATVLQGFGV